MTVHHLPGIQRPRNEELGFYARNVLALRANGDTLRNGQGADSTPAEARAELLRHGYRQVPESPVESESERATAIHEDGTRDALRPRRALG